MCNTPSSPKKDDAMQVCDGMCFCNPPFDYLRAFIECFQGWRRGGVNFTSFYGSFPCSDLRPCEGNTVKHCEALDETKQAISAVRCASRKLTFAMQCMFTAVCALAAEIHCDIGNDASFVASAMLRCGEIR